MMVRLLKQFLSSEKGQALPIVLALLAVGGLTIAVSLDYATTSLKGGRILEEHMKGVYAAGAGVERVLWSLGYGISPPTQLPENINQMAVNMQTEEKGTYTLYLGELVQPGVHFEYLDVDGDMVWDEEAEVYKYTITITWQPDSGEPVIHLMEVGARLPVGCGYQSGSAASFVDNLSTGEPDEMVDTLEVCMLNWELGLPRPSVSEDNPVQTQTFYLTGEESQGGDYAWVVAARDDIGAVGEISGTSYKIWATATRSGDGRTTAKIVADVMIGDGTTHILSWQVY